MRSVLENMDIVIDFHWIKYILHTTMGKMYMLYDMLFCMCMLSIPLNFVKRHLGLGFSMYEFLTVVL